MHTHIKNKTKTTRPKNKKANTAQHKQKPNKNKDISKQTRIHIKTHKHSKNLHTKANKQK